MLAKLATILVVVAVLLFGTSIVSFVVFPDAKQIDPGVTLRVQAAGISNNVAPWQMGNRAVARVRAFADKGAPLSADAFIGDYPANYMGLIGYAWQLPRTAELSDANEWAYAVRQNYAVEISHIMLQPGDILMNDRSGDYGHALVFAQWRNPTQWTARDFTDRAQQRARFEQGVPFIAYEVERFQYPARVLPKQYTLKWSDGAMTIVELDRELHGPYDALRHNQIAGYAELFSPVSVSFKNTSNTVTTNFRLVNRGGAPIVVENISAVAYGPDALHQGVAGTPNAFPEIKRVVLQPGQIYEYQQTRTLAQAGTFLVLARFQVNGAVQMPAQPVFFQIAE